MKINYNELLNVIEYLKIVIYIAHRQDEQKEEFIFDKNNEIHRIVEFLVGILEKKYAIGLSKKSIEEILKVLHKNIKREIGSISSFTNYLILTLFVRDLYDNDMMSKCFSDFIIAMRAFAVFRQTAPKTAPAYQPYEAPLNSAACGMPLR